ncbi:MAG: hypothetical protein LBR16_04180 [Treponema sp.]|nr:hypothetical protein [Treponema sp.]
MLVILAVVIAGIVWQNAKAKTTDAKIDVMGAKFEAKFAALDAKFEARFVEMEAKFGARFAAIEARFAAIDEKFVAMEARFAAMDEKFVAMEARFDGKLMSLEKAIGITIDEKINAALSAFYVKLKDNDFAHMNNAFRSLTFVLQQNEVISREQKTYIDSALEEKVDGGRAAAAAEEH